MHLEQGERAKRKKPSTYKSVRMTKTNTNGGNFSRNVEIPSCFGYIDLTDSTPVPDQECQSDFAAGSVMASPSPLDRCWTLKETSGSLAILPALRAAVENHWPALQRAALSALGDESLAGKLWMAQSRAPWHTLPTIRRKISERWIPSAPGYAATNSVAGAGSKSTLSLSILPRLPRPVRRIRPYPLRTRPSTLKRFCAMLPPRSAKR